MHMVANCRCSFAQQQSLALPSAMLAQHCLGITSVFQSSAIYMYSTCVRYNAANACTCFLFMILSASWRLKAAI